MFHSLLNISAARSYVPYQVLENKQMLYQILLQPNDVLKHIRRYSNALTTSMVFGWRTPTYEDPKMQQLFTEFAKFSDLNQTGTAALIDFFPLLRYLPSFLNQTQKKAQQHHQREKKLYLEHWLNAKSAIAESTIKPCFCVGMAEAQRVDGFSDEQACYTSGTLLEAGSDTTSSTLYGFVQAMVLNPEAQKMAQDEIDRVIGPDKLPTMDDESDLQYVRQCMKEALRWMPTTIMGAVPHAVTQDDEYMGYLIPKGAGVMNNVWSIHRDPERYPEPRKFDPSRYDNDTQSLGDSAANPDPRKRDQFTFGAGRRICPGIHVAERSLFLGISRMLWAFNIEPAQQENGSPIYPDQERLTQGFLCAPEPFPVRIVPRSQARADLVTKEWKEAETELLDPQTKQWRESPVASISYSSKTK